MMNNLRICLALALAGMLVIAPVGALQANDAHHAGTAATKQAPAKVKGKMLKTKTRTQSGQLMPAEKGLLRTQIT